ncbi:DUF6713 family protein [Tunicatimonas pelagia]|uniref:DUF6713 family protein n=1 Tax=Tunicatimonas pelagia TaxID=931531 RepID=UPI00345CA5D6
MIAFYLSMAFLTVHELDAVRCKKWRILPGLSSLNDEYGMLVFNFAHIPLFIWIFYNLSSLQIESTSSFRTGFDIFSIIHVGLHTLLLRNPNNEFKDWASWVLIIGAAAFGFIDLLFR